MIVSFGDAATEELFHGGKSRKIPANVLKVAVRKLDYLNAATTLTDLRVPPGNRLEALKGDLAGYYSIRVNAQFRIVFKWDNGAHEVRFCDYH